MKAFRIVLEVKRSFHVSSPFYSFKKLLIFTYYFASGHDSDDEKRRKYTRQYHPGQQQEMCLLKTREENTSEHPVQSVLKRRH